MTDKRYFGYRAPAGASLEKAFHGLADFLLRLNRQGWRAVKVYAGMNPAEATDGARPLSPASLQSSLDSVLTARLGLERSPAVTLVAQRPLGDNDNSVLCAEIIGVEEKPMSVRPTPVRSVRLDGLTHILIKSPEYTELWSSGFHTDYGDRSTQEAAERSFEQMAGTLRSQGFTFDDIFRQWNYIGHIVDFRPDAGGGLRQNYQAFNEVRAGFYAAKRHKDRYPAATGIGMDYEGLCIDFVAVKACDAAPRDVPRDAGDPTTPSTAPGSNASTPSATPDPALAAPIPTALRSPVQTDAFSYNQEVLVGEMENKKAPLFERGCRHGNTIMISGTASIRGQETVDKDDTDKQLQNTVGFIEDLIRHNLKEKTARTRMRLYIKPGTMPSRSALDNLKRHYPAPCLINIVEADICRPELLVEVEEDLRVI